MIAKVKKKKKKTVISVLCDEVIDQSTSCVLHRSEFTGRFSSNWVLGLRVDGGKIERDQIRVHVLVLRQGG